MTDKTLNQYLDHLYFFQKPLLPKELFKENKDINYFVLSEKLSWFHRFFFPTLIEIILKEIAKIIEQTIPEIDLDETLSVSDDEENDKESSDDEDDDFIKEITRFIESNNVIEDIDKMNDDSTSFFFQISNRPS